VAGIVVLVLVVAAGIVAATSPFWYSSRSPMQTTTQHGHHSGTKPAASASVITPTTASGFDPLTSVSNDPGNENSRSAPAVLGSSPAAYWSTQYYDTAEFGNLKKGSGLILTMPGKIRLSSIQVEFGQEPGADVQIMVGNSDVRSPSALGSMTTVAQASDVSGTHTFTTRSTATGRYVLIWFTKLPPSPPQISSGQFLAQVFHVVVRGSSA